MGSLGGASLGGLILDSFPFAAVNLTAGAICALCAAVAWLSLPVPTLAAVAANPEHAGAAKPKAATGAPIAALLALMGMLLASRMVLQVPFSLYMTQVFGARHWVAGLTYGLLACGFVVAAPLWARLFENRTPSYVLGGNVLISAACVLVTHLAGSTSSVAVFALLYFIWGMLLGGTTPVLLALISVAVAHDRQGSVLGLAQASQQAASASGIIAGVAVTQLFGLKAAFPLVAMLYALSFLSALGICLKIAHPTRKGIRS